MWLSDNRNDINREMREEWRKRYIYEWEVIIICDGSNNEFISWSIEFHDQSLIISTIMPGCILLLRGINYCFPNNFNMFIRVCHGYWFC